MWRALTAAALFSLLLAPSAHACPTSFHTRTIMFEAIPSNTPSSTLVLRVSFPEFGQQSERWLDSVNVIDAPVLEVVQGEYAQPTVPVVMGFGTCDRTPFGQQGLIIGSLGAVRDDAGMEHPVFYPRSESFGDRFQPVCN